MSARRPAHARDPRHGLPLREMAPRAARAGHVHPRQGNSFRAAAGGRARDRGRRARGRVESVGVEADGSAPQGAQITRMPLLMFVRVPHGPITSRYHAW